MKPVGTVIQTNPLIVHVNKNGRAVHKTIAQRYVEKHYPEVISWKLTKTDHSILAEAQ